MNSAKRPSKVYLDYAAATPIDERLVEVMAEVERKHFANPSSMHTPGREAAKVLDSARKRVAMVLGAKTTEIVFTSGSTEGANMAILGTARKYPSARLVASAIEHEAVLGPIAAWKKAGGKTGIIPVGSSGIPNGIVDSADVVKSIDDQTVLVCVMYVNNEIGTIQPISKIASDIVAIRADRRSRSIDLPLFLYCDAAQAGLQNLKVDTLGVDLLSMGGSKIYGPHGTGFLYVRTGVELEPTAYGGGHESGRRSGTPNVAGVEGFTEAFEIMMRSRSTELLRLRGLRDNLEKEITTNISGVTIHGNLRFRAYHITNASFDGVDGEALVAHLDAAGFAVATGSACTAGDEDPSHVLLAMGLSKTHARSSLRVSLGRQTTAADIGRFASALAASVQRLRGMATGQIDR